MQPKSKLFATLSLLLLFLTVGAINKVSAATRYWVGDDGAAVNVATNWKTTDPAGCGSGDASAAPGSADTAVFDADCDNGAAITASWNLLKLQTNSGYTGIITQNATTTLTIDPGSSGDALAIASGTFTDAGNASTVIDINDGNFNQTGGTFTNTGTGAFTIEQNFTLSGGTFTNTGNTVTFDGVDESSTITCSGTLGGTVVITQGTVTTSVGGGVTIASGCSISLGASPTTTIDSDNDLLTTFTNNGTITVASGTWTLNEITGFNHTLVNNGVI